MTDLSVLIPSRNEIFLSRTIQDILENMRGDTEVIAVLDGAWADPPIPDNDRVTLVYHSVSIGQRAACNEAARLSTAKYVMKCDAHCAFDEGFDVKLMADMQDDWTVVPVMRNLHTFNWVCPNGHRRYQSPSGPCKECGEPTTRDVVWIAKTNPQSTAYCFDPEPHFQYMSEFKKRPEGRGELTETMSLQGSCFMATREKYWELDLCDESFGSWGSQGLEVALRTWLSGGRVMVNHKTWYAHQFRTQGGDFGFPYPLSGKQVDHAKKRARELFWEQKWPKQIYPVSWLVKKFWPIHCWKDEDLAKLEDAEASTNFRGFKTVPSTPAQAISQPEAESATPPEQGTNMTTSGILYYTCNTHSLDIEMACRRQLEKVRNGHELGTVSRQPIDFGDWNIVIDLPKSAETMHKQILAGLELMDTDFVFLCESDVLYHKSHFDFIPPDSGTFWFNTNVWKVRYEDGHAVWTDDLQQVSGICADRKLLLDFYRKRVEQIAREGFNQHYEPGPKLGKYKTANWMSEYPNLDIRHRATLTKSKWSPDEFRNKQYAKGWKEASQVAGWGVTEGRLNEILEAI